MKHCKRFIPQIIREFNVFVIVQILNHFTDFGDIKTTQSSDTRHTIIIYFFLPVRKVYVKIYARTKYENSSN